MSVPNPVIKIVHGDQLNNDTIIVNSPHRLVVGGSAIFERFDRSHQVVRRGSVVCRPRAKSIVRLCVRS